MEVSGSAVPVVSRRFAAVRHGTVIAVIGMVTIVDVSVEVFGSVIPGAGADEYAAGEPLRAVVALGSAIVRRNGVIATGAGGGRSDIDGDMGIGACGSYE
jgi:hypothetical protein